MEAREFGRSERAKKPKSGSDEEPNTGGRGLKKNGMATNKNRDIRHFRDLDVYRLAFDCAMKIL
jgi:hypothetical protein